jgi:hypothetical protein
VKAFSRAYFSEQDKLAGFVQQRCERDASFTVSSSDFMYELNEWLSEDSSPKMSSKSIAASMSRKGYAKKQTWTNGKNLMSFVGIRLKNEDLFVQDATSSP